MDNIGDRIIKGYQLREYLGAGGLGAVYRAYQAAFERDVVIKLIRSDYFNHPDFIRSFEIEAQQIARLDHPNIVPVYDYWRDADGACVVMRWLPRGNLRAASVGKIWNLAEISELLMATAAALTFGHSQGIVHQRLKPENILLDDDKRACVTDFNLSVDLDLRLPSAQTANLNSSNVYLSPEQIRHEAVTPQTDVYSLGLVLYELLTGRQPFQDGTANYSLMSRQLNEPLPPLDAYRTDVPSALNAVIQKATAKDPKHRFDEALSLATAFREILTSGLISSLQTRRDALTDREVSILRLIGDGLSNREIAHRLSFSVDTIKWYLKQIYSKLDAHSRIQAVERARSLNLLNTIYPQASQVRDVSLALPEADRLLANPYKGLRSFQVADAHDFFGRDTLVSTLLSRLAETDNEPRFLAVVGPSGSGKSSVVRAGLIPALREGALTGSERWFFADILPDAHPVDEIESALLRLAVNPPPDLSSLLRQSDRGLLQVVRRLLPDEKSQLLLIIDQFEEVFTLVDDAEERTHFLDSLVAAVSDPQSQLRVIITLRADFYDRPLQYPRFGELIEHRTQVVLPFTSYELEQAIVGPANRVGVNIEAGLVSAMVAEVYERPGALPLLQYALTELFDKRDGHVLTLTAYQLIGGTMGALARRADTLYEELNSEGQEATRQLFLRLVTLGEGTEDTRRRTLQIELRLAGADGDRMEELIDLFSRYRLLTLDRDAQTGIPAIEIAHEALIRTWGRLREWLAASREDLRLHRRLAIATAEWVNAGYERSFLASGARLDQFEAWVQSTTLALNQDEHNYLQASRKARNAEEALDDERKAKEAATARLARNFQRITAILGVIGGLSIIAIVVLALQAARALGDVNVAGQTLTPIPATLTRIARSIADSNTTMELLRLSAEANKLLLAHNGNVETAALLGIRALNTGYLAEADSALMQSIENMYTRQVFAGHTKAVYGVAFSPDGKYIVSGSGDGTLRLWDVKEGKVTDSFRGHTDAVYSVAFSPDGRYFLSGSKDHTARLWDIQARRTVRIFGARRNPVYSPGHFGPINSVAFSPDGNTIVTGGDFSVRVWNIQTGRNIRTIHPAKTCAVFSVTYSPDGKSVGIGCNDQIAYIWDIQTGQPVHRFKGHTGSVWAVQFSPDGRYILTGSRDSTVRLWDIQTEKTVRTFTGHASDVPTLAFSPDGKYILTGGADQTARLWDVQTGQLIRLLSGHVGSIWSAAFSPDGNYGLTGADDGMVRLWDVSSSQKARTFATQEGIVWSVAFSPDGSSISSTGDDHTVRLWNAQTRQPLITIAEHGSVYMAVFSPDGRYLLTGSNDETARLWDVKTGQLVRSFVGTGTGGWIYAVAFSPDGKQLVMGGDDRIARLWDVKTGQVILTLSGHTETVTSLVFSPDDRYVLSGSYDKTAQLWDVQTKEIVRTFSGHSGYVNSVAFSPDGKYVLTGSADMTARLWNAQTGEVVRVFSGHSDAVSSVAFSPDGERILTGSADTTARLWDVETGQVMRVFSGHMNAVTSVAFSPDGKAMVTGSADKTVRIWQVGYQDFVAYACTRLVRDFTADERLHYGLADDKPTCPQFAETATPSP
jgi:WD40 repeat protein/serine/threonine protein kinase